MLLWKVNDDRERLGGNEIKPRKRRGGLRTGTGCPAERRLSGQHSRRHPRRHPPSSKPIFPIGPSQRHSMSHAKRDPGGKTRAGGWIGIEGLVVLLVGIYAAVQPENAAGIMRQLIAFVLLIVSAGRIIEGFRFRTSAAAPWATLRGGVGITVAALTLLSPLSQYIQGDGSRQILGLGLLAYGALGVIGSLAASGERRYRWGSTLPATCWRSCSGSSR